MVHLCSPFNIIQCPRTPNSPRINGLVEVQNCNCGIFLRLFLQHPPKIGHSEPKCRLILITLLHFLDLNFRRIKLFSIHTLVFHLPFSELVT